MGMKRSSGDVANDIESRKAIYKKARKAYKQDKSNNELKIAKDKAKKALKEAESLSAADVVTNSQPSSSSVEEKNDINNKTSSTDDDNDNIKALEEEYQKALAKFKADKSNKDLRRAKTAARRKLDAAILQTTNDGDKQLVCVDCSKKFIFTVEQQQKHTDMGWNSQPKRCEVCKKMRNDKSKQIGGREKLDSQKKNMCYAYQRGECPHGINCKFSHNPEFGGKRSGSNGKSPSLLDKEKKGSDTTSSKDMNDDEGTQSKERKEKSLRKKNGKVWRNK